MNKKQGKEDTKEVDSKEEEEEERRKQIQKVYQRRRGGYLLQGRNYKIVPRKKRRK